VGFRPPRPLRGSAGNKSEGKAFKQPNLRIPFTSTSTKKEITMFYRLTNQFEIPLALVGGFVLGAVPYVLNSLLALA
jgi:hypothetical protein